MKAFNSIITNTKVRRLGYFLQVVKEIGKSSLGENAVIARLTSWSETNINLLEQHIDSTGTVKKSPKDTSAHRYLSCASNIGLMDTIGGECKLTKYGKVLLSLMDRTSFSPFSLTLTEACFLLNRLLLLDSDYLVPILQFLDEHGECDLSTLQKQFRNIVLSWLEVKLRYFFTREAESKNEILRAENRIKSWTKPEKYVEHIVPPRVHWLLDLQLLDWMVYKKQSKFALATEGKTFFSHLRKVQNYAHVDRTWLENDYFKSFLEAFLPNTGMVLFSALDRKKQRAIVLDFIERCLGIFRTTELLRIAASQFLYYTCVNLSVIDKISCGFDNLKQWLNEISADSKASYYFYWSAQQDDGHITRREGRDLYGRQTME